MWLSPLKLVAIISLSPRWSICSLTLTIFKTPLPILASMMLLHCKAATATGQINCIKATTTPGIRLLTLIRLWTSASITGCQTVLTQWRLQQAQCPPLTTLWLTELTECIHFQAWPATIPILNWYVGAVTHFKLLKTTKKQWTIVWAIRAQQHM